MPKVKRPRKTGQRFNGPVSVNKFRSVWAQEWLDELDGWYVVARAGGMPGEITSITKDVTTGRVYIDVEMQPDGEEL